MGRKIRWISKRGRCEGKGRRERAREQDTHAWAALLVCERMDACMRVRAGMLSLAWSPLATVAPACCMPWNTLERSLKAKGKGER